MRVAPATNLSLQERKKLEASKRGRATAVRAKERSAIVLLAADGLQNKKVGERLGEDVVKVWRWDLYLRR